MVAEIASTSAWYHVFLHGLVQLLLLIFFFAESLDSSFLKCVELLDKLTQILCSQSLDSYTTS